MLKENINIYYRYLLFFVTILIVSFIFINPQTAKANDTVNTITCKDISDYKNIGKSGGCTDARTRLMADWQAPAYNITDGDNNKKKVTLHWTSPKIFSGATQSKMKINFSNNAELAKIGLGLAGLFTPDDIARALTNTKTIWNFNTYYLEVKGPDGKTDRVQMTGTATNNNNHEYTYIATPTSDNKQNFEFTIVSEYKFDTTQCTVSVDQIPVINKILEIICKNASTLSVINNWYISNLQKTLDIPNNTISVDIKSGATALSDLSPKIKSGKGTYDSSTKTGSAELIYAASDNIKNEKATISSYKLHRRRVQDGSNGVMGQVSNASFPNGVTCTSCSVTDQNVVKNLTANTSVSYEYFIEAQYKNDTNQYFSNGWIVTFTADADGNVTASTQSGSTTPPSTSTFYQTTAQSGQDKLPSSSACETTLGCEVDRDTIQKYVCKAVCWVSDGTYGLLLSAFEIFKGANSLNSTNPYTPNIQSVIQNGSSSSSNSSTSTTPTASSTAKPTTTNNTSTTNNNPNTSKPTTASTPAVQIESQ